MSIQEDIQKNRTLNYIRPLERVSRAQISEVGGKAANLGELLKAGFPVPDGYVLTAKAFKKFVEANKFASNDLHPEIIRTGRMPEEIKNELLSIIDNYGNLFLAVRSSCVEEDLSTASFAGQYETVLGVKGIEELDAAIKRCWGVYFFG